MVSPAKAAAGLRRMQLEATTEVQWRMPMPLPPGTPALEQVEAGTRRKVPAGSTSRCGSRSPRWVKLMVRADRFPAPRR